MHSCNGPGPSSDCRSEVVSSKDESDSESEESVGGRTSIRDEDDIDGPDGGLKGDTWSEGSECSDGDEGDLMELWKNTIDAAAGDLSVGAGDTEEGDTRCGRE